MRNIVAINVSPRTQGTSVTLLNRLKDELEKRGNHVHIVHLYSHLKDMQPIFDSVNNADTIVISGPCYTNTYPADTTRLLEELASHPDALHGQNLYGIIQGGMPYAHTHISGLNMLGIFASKVDLRYQGGFIMGFGAMLDGQPLNKLPNSKKVERQLGIFFEHIANGQESPSCVYEAAMIKMPRFVVKILVVLVNRKTDKEYAARGMNASNTSPYLNDEIQ